MENMILGYAYLAFPEKEQCFEFISQEQAKRISQETGGVYFDHFPYKEYGFEDPFAFANEWLVIDTNGDIVEYSYTEAGAIREEIF